MTAGQWSTVVVSLVALAGAATAYLKAHTASQDIKDHQAKDHIGVR